MNLSRIGMAVLAVVLLLSGCQAQEVDLVPQDAAEAIMERVGFRDSLVQADEDVAESFYSLDNVSEYAIFISGSGGSAEEIAVLKVSHRDDLPKAREAAEARLSTLKRMFEDYRPDEMVKLREAVLETRGNVVYFVVADDPQEAIEAIDSLYSVS